MTYKGIEIGDRPTIEMLEEVIKEHGFDLDASVIYEKYEKRGWKTLKHKPIKNVEAIINAANGAVIFKKIKKGEAVSKKEKRIPKPPQEDKRKSRKENYYDFLNSDYWKYVRKLKLKSAGGKCQICGGKHNLVVHHNSYAHHKEEHKHLEDLVVLCRKCHEKFHDVVKD